MWLFFPKPTILGNFVIYEKSETDEIKFIFLFGKSGKKFVQFNEKTIKIDKTKVSFPRGGTASKKFLFAGKGKIGTQKIVRLKRVKLVHFFKKIFLVDISASYPIS